MRTFLLITGSLILGILLTLLPLPQWAVWLWPRWAVLISIYWALMLPRWYGIGVAWLVGILLDLVQGTLLGEQAFALAFVTYFVAKFYMKIRQLIDGWRLAVIFLLLLLYQVILFVLQVFLQKMPFLWEYWLSAFTSALVWLFIVNPALKACQRRFNVQDHAERRFLYDQ